MEAGKEKATKKVTVTFSVRAYSEVTLEVDKDMDKEEILNLAEEAYADSELIITGHKVSDYDDPEEELEEDLER